MASARYTHGEIRDVWTPVWEPLEELLGSDDLCAHFMWMACIELTGGTVLQAYKHRWTRRYLHLTADGRAYDYRGDGDYARVDPAGAISAAFGVWASCRATASERQAVSSAIRRARSSLDEPRPG